MSKIIASLVLALCLAPAVASATTTPSNIPNTMRDYAGTLAARDLLVRADEVLNSITYTTYSWENYWNDFTGRYKVNCTQYLDRLLDDAAPLSFDEVKDYCDCNWPKSEDYQDFFKSIPVGTTKNGWTRIGRVADMKPGDLLAEKYSSDSGSTGHTMLIVSLPTKVSGTTNQYRVRVSDSAKSGHSNDNRGSSGSGVGAGEIIVKAGSTSGAPIAYKWRLSSTSWHTGSLAIGRPAK